MLQALKHTHRWLSFIPGGMFAGLRYRMLRWNKSSRAIPEQLLQAFAADELAGENFKHLSFTFSAIALSARLACIDGPLTRDKYVAFREAFPLKGEICGKIRSLFILACDNSTPYEHYVTQIKCAFPGRTELYKALLDRLFRIAATQGTITREADHMLSSIAHILELSAAQYAAIRHLYDRPSKAHRVLGVAPRASKEVVKKRYHELMQQYHPDRYAGEDLTPELELLLRVKASEINAAYRTLAKQAA